MMDVLISLVENLRMRWRVRQIIELLPFNKVSHHEKAEYEYKTVKPNKLFNIARWEQ